MGATAMEIYPAGNKLIWKEPWFRKSDINDGITILVKSREQATRKETTYLGLPRNGRFEEQKNMWVYDGICGYTIQQHNIYI